MMCGRGRIESAQANCHYEELAHSEGTVYLEANDPIIMKFCNP